MRWLLALLLALYSPAAMAAWGTPSSLTTAQSSSAVHSLASSGVTVAQNSLVVITGAMTAHANGDTVVVTDAAGNTYTVFQRFRSGGTNVTFIAYAVASTALSTSAVTVADTSTGATTFTSCAFAVISVSGGATSSVEDSAARGGNDGAATTTPTVTSGTPGTAGDLFFVAYGSGNSNGGTYTEDGTWTNIANKVGNGSITTSSAYLINVGTGTKTHAPTTASQGYEQVTTAFLLATGAVAVPRNALLLGVGS